MSPCVKASWCLLPRPWMPYTLGVCQTSSCDWLPCRGGVVTDLILPGCRVAWTATLDSVVLIQAPFTMCRWVVQPVHVVWWLIRVWVPMLMWFLVTQPNLPMTACQSGSTVVSSPAQSLRTCQGATTPDRKGPRVVAHISQQFA